MARSLSRSALVLFVACTLSSTTAVAEKTRFYNLEGFGTWLDGNPETTGVTEEGEVILAVPARERYADPAAAFGAATALGDEIVVARNDDGRVLAIDRAGKTREIFKAEDGLVSAMIASGDRLFIAVSPPAKIFVVDRSGKATEFHTPDAGFIWDMAVGADGSLYAVTGEPGTVIRIDKSGRDGEILFEPEQEHLRSIAVDASMGVFVGGGERGILYRATPRKPKVFRALFDTGHPEITSIVVQGTHAYVAGVTGAAALAAEEGNEQQGGKGKSKGPEVRSQLVRVAMDGTAEVLAGSSDEAVFDIAIDDRGFIVVATGATGRDDPRGRLYTIEPKQRLISMIYQSPSRRITHLVPLPRGAMGAIAAGGGRVVHLAGGVAKRGEFFTTPFDTVINSQFGIIQIFAQLPKGTRVTAAVRTGQTKKPDDTWSEWSAEISAPGNQHPKTENGRFLQLRLTLHGDGKLSPRVNRVRLAYMRHNLRPFVREVTTLKKGFALLPVIRETQKSKSINLKDKTKSSRHDSDDDNTKNHQRARQVPSEGALTVKWVADDPNGDTLKYDLMVRRQDQSDWRAVEDDLERPFYTLHSAQLPDGHYQFRVRATDSPSNPQGMEQTDTRESKSVLIDNTPPSVDPLQVTTTGKRSTIRTVVADAVGPLMLAEYALDGNEFQVMAPDDGVLDGPGESFTIRLGELDAGRHTVTVRVMDEGENVGYGEASFVVR